MPDARRPATGDRVHVLITFALEDDLVARIRAVDPRIEVSVLGSEQRKLLRGFSSPSERERAAVAEGLQGAFGAADVVFGFWGAELHQAFTGAGYVQRIVAGEPLLSFRPALGSKSVLHQLPLAAPEQYNACDGDGRFRHGYGNEHAQRAELKSFRQQICQRNLECPEARRVCPVWFPRIARAVERIDHNHPDAIENITGAYYPERIHYIFQYSTVFRKYCRDPICSCQEQYGNDGHEDGVVRGRSDHR